MLGVTAFGSLAVVSSVLAILGSEVSIEARAAVCAGVVLLAVAFAAVWYHGYSEGADS